MDTGEDNAGAAMAIEGVAGATGVNLQIDALPYSDKGFNAKGVKEAAQAMVREELKAMRAEGITSATYEARLPPMPQISTQGRDMTETAMKRIASKRKMEQLDMTRYEVPQPSAAKKNNIGEWSKCVDNARAQSEHSRNRLDNLELMNAYGSQAWKGFTESLDKSAEGHEKELKTLKEQVQDVNWQRKTEQVAAGEELMGLSTQWGQLISKNYEIELACKQLEGEIGHLNQQVA